MKGTLKILYNKKGELQDSPTSIVGSMDIDKEREAYFFPDDKSTFHKLHVLSFEIHAMGIFLKGFEEPTGDKRLRRYNEWFITDVSSYTKDDLRKANQQT